MEIKSKVFSQNTPIPKQFTCEGKNTNPPFNIEKIPKGTKSLSLIVEDPDTTKGSFVHWVVYNIEPVEMISEDSVPGIEGENDFGKKNYGGPCPPIGAHRYFFKLYALDDSLDLPDGASKVQVEKAMKGHVIEHCELIGLYERS